MREITVSNVSMNTVLYLFMSALPGRANAAVSSTSSRITAAFFMVSRTSNDQNELIITKTRQFYKRRALTGIATGKRLSIRAKM